MLCKLALFVGLVAVASAVDPPTAGYDCTTLRHYSVDNCDQGEGLVLSSLDVLTECSNYICTNVIGFNSITRGDPSSKKKLSGSGYGCKIEDWDGGELNDVICMPAPESSGSSSSGLTGGEVFLIIFFVGGAVYFTGGMAYMFFAKGERGVNMIHALEFWKDFPNLLKDGAMFIKNKATGGGYSSV
eukprot:TRINITY_DN2094_c6_g1_i1.p1 TRINITY_DN2094_c6_g1~~TRINITY_DN2094_c6_g1_i1.p1  ORF type:complete len:186 (+),score=27.55 TRINITY_DN2094_c6_g1_i1:56-613(+)